MNPEAVKQILESLEKNGGAALDGIAANAYIQAWGELILLPVLTLVTASLFLFAHKCYRKAEDAPRDREGLWVGGTIASSVIAAICAFIVLIAVCRLPETIATIKNPKAAAIRILIGK